MADHFDVTSGAAGIIPPSPKAMGGLSAAQVRQAYAKTKRMLGAAGLDRKTILGGTPAKFIAAIPAELRDDVKRAHVYVVSLKPGSAELASQTIKVRGTMKAKAARRGGVRGIDVKVDYLFVYAIRQPGKPDTVQRLVARLTGTWFHDTGSGDRYLYFEQARSAAPAKCKPKDGFIHPSFDRVIVDPSESDPAGPAVDPYDQSREGLDKCGSATRT